MTALVRMEMAQARLSASSARLEEAFEKARRGSDLYRFLLPYVAGVSVVLVRCTRAVKALQAADSRPLLLSDGGHAMDKELADALGRPALLEYRQTLMDAAEPELLLDTCVAAVGIVDRIFDLLEEGQVATSMH